MVLSTNKMGGLISTHLSKGEKMKYLILQDTIANKEKVKAGDIVELPIDEEDHLLVMVKLKNTKANQNKNQIEVLA